MGHTPKMPRELSRQDFLRGAAGALAIGAVFGAPRASADPRADAWAQLARAIDGQVKLPADGGPFNAAKAVFNTNFGGMTPAAVVAPTSLTDVRKTMEFAASRGAHVAPRGGGHSYTGASTANGVMILDLRQLPGDIAYDAGTGRVTVTPATQLYAIHQVLAANGRGIPTGTCPTVGVAGHALGGGLGASSRRGGLLSDQLVSATVVLPGGTAVTASATENPDLFWGLRGGGGGNFGVTTSLTFATIPAGDVDVVNLHYPIQAFAQALLGWQSWLRTVGPESWALIDAGSNPTHADARIMATCPVGSAGAVTAAITKAVGLAPAATNARTVNHLELVKYLAADNLHPAPLGYVGGSDVFQTITPRRRAGDRRRVRGVPRWRRASAGDHARSRRGAVLGGADGDPVPVAAALLAGAVVRRDRRLTRCGRRMAGRRAPCGGAVFGWRLCELSGGEPAGVAVLRRQPGPVECDPPQVRSGRDHVLRTEPLRVQS